MDLVLSYYIGEIGLFGIGVECNIYYYNVVAVL